MARFVSRGRRIRGASGAPRGGSGAIGREQTQMIREGALAGGYRPNSRGSISRALQEAYDAAHG